MFKVIVAKTVKTAVKSASKALVNQRQVVFKATKQKINASIAPTKLGQYINKSKDKILKLAKKGEALFQNSKYKELTKEYIDRIKEIKEYNEVIDNLNKTNVEAKGLNNRKVRSQTVRAIQYSPSTQTMIIYFNPITTMREPNYPNGMPTIVVFNVDSKEVAKFQRTKNHMRYYNENYSFKYSPRKYDTATLAQAYQTLQQLEIDGRKDPMAMAEWRTVFEHYREKDMSMRNINKAKVRAKKAIKERKDLFKQF